VYDRFKAATPEQMVLMEASQQTQPLVTPVLLVRTQTPQ
jgi:hypothetical protein